MKRLKSILAILCLLLLTQTPFALITQNQQSLTTSKALMEYMPNSKGSLNIEKKLSGKTGPAKFPRTTSSIGESGITASLIAVPGDEKWDDQFFLTGSNENGIRIIIADGNTLYVGGDFTTIGNISANNVAKWDGSSWSALGSGVNGNVRALTILNGEIYAGGTFTTAGGVSAN
jgi:hypothetical protein